MPVVTQPQPSNVARIEDALVIVGPPDPKVLVPRTAENLEDLSVAPLITEVFTGDLNHVSGLQPIPLVCHCSSWTLSRQSSRSGRARASAESEAAMRRTTLACEAVA